MLHMMALSDMHGNYAALQKCLDCAANMGINTFLFLGDHLGKLAYPQKNIGHIICKLPIDCQWLNIPEECPEQAAKEILPET